MAAICEIDFVNNPMKFIYAGQWLRGTVRLTLTKAKNVSGVYIDFRGTAYLKFSNRDGNVRTTLTSKRKYLDEGIWLVGGDQSGKFLLSPGSYNYTFQFMLPPNIPTSFEGKYGYIRYTANVVVDYVPQRRNKEFEVPFTVIQAVNLNDYPQLREPVIVEGEKTFFLCLPLTCWTSNLLRIAARTPIGGFLPGQIINLEINVKNDSFVSISKFSVKLMKQITYFTIEGEDLARETITVIKQKTKRGCGVAEKEDIRVYIKVPQILPSPTSDMFKVRYFIRIIGSVGICHKNPVLELPITILSEPIHI